MDTLGVVVVDVLAEQSSQVVLVQDDDVIEEFATYGTDDTFRGSVLPWASEGCPLRVDLEALDRARDGGRRQGCRGGAALRNGPGCAWGAECCSISRPGTSLNLGIDRVYLPRVGVEDGVEKLSNISTDAY